MLTPRPFPARRPDAKVGSSALDECPSRTGGFLAFPAHPYELQRTTNIISLLGPLSTEALLAVTTQKYVPGRLATVCTGT